MLEQQHDEISAVRQFERWRKQQFMNLVTSYSESGGFKLPFPSHQRLGKFGVTGSREIK